MKKHLNSIASERKKRWTCKNCKWKAQFNAWIFRALHTDCCSCYYDCFRICLFFFLFVMPQFDEYNQHTDTKGCQFMLFCLDTKIIIRQWANNTYVVWVVVNSRYCMVNRTFPDQSCNRWKPCHRGRVFPSSHHRCKNIYNCTFDSLVK